MGRAKLPLVPITRERYKNTTYQKRKAGLFKKLREFTILCGVEACAIVYGPQPKRNGNGPVKAETWPAETDDVRRILRRSAGNIRGKHSHDLSDFLAVRKGKMEREIAKQRVKNWRAEYSGRDIMLQGLAEAQLRQFLAVLEGKLEEAVRVKNSRMVEKGLPVSVSRFGGFDDMIKADMSNVYQNQNNSYGGFYSLPDYIDEGLLERAMEKRKEMEGKEEEQRTLCPVPVLAMKMKYLPYHDRDQDVGSGSSMMLWSSNNFQNYASQLGLYDHNYSTAPMLGGFGAGGDGFQYCSGDGGGGGGSAGPYTSNSFQYYTALLGGGDVGSSSGSNMQYYALLGGGGGGGGGSSNGNSLKYYTSLLGGGEEGCSNDTN